MDAPQFFTTDDGVTLHYRLWRGGERRPLIVLLHGMASNLTRWSEFVEHTSLKERFDILRLDLRGHGRSFTRRPIGMERWVHDLVSILEAQGYERAIVVGHSLGANVALWFAAHAPQRTDALVLIDPVLTEALQGGARWIHRLAPLLRLLVWSLRLLNWLGFRRRHIPLRDLRQLDEQVREQLLGAGKEADFVKRYTSPRADLRYFPTVHYVQELVEITRPVPALAQLHAPALALISQAVTFTDTGRTRAALARCPRLQAEMLSAYHWPLTEKPVEVRRSIETWCAQRA
jgi:pimeloyl-ACP methyl ester carboxylesterase